MPVASPSAYDRRCEPGRLKPLTEVVRVPGSIEQVRIPDAASRIDALVSALDNSSRVSLRRASWYGLGFVIADHVAETGGHRCR
jgi:hypothetical protein